MCRKSPSHHHHSSGPGASFAAHNNPKDRSTRSKSRSNMLTCANLFSAATCVSKVCFAPSTVGDYFPHCVIANHFDPCL